MTHCLLVWVGSIGGSTLSCPGSGWVWHPHGTRFWTVDCSVAAQAGVVAMNGYTRSGSIRGLRKTGGESRMIKKGCGYLIGSDAHCQPDFFDVLSL